MSDDIIIKPQPTLVTVTPESKTITVNQDVTRVIKTQSRDLTVTQQVDRVLRVPQTILPPLLVNGDGEEFLANDGVYKRIQADIVDYDNTDSGLVAINVQDGMDETVEYIKQVEKDRIVQAGTHLWQGGLFTKSLNPLKFSVSAGIAYFVDSYTDFENPVVTKIIFEATEQIPILTTSRVTVVFLNKFGSFSTQNNLFTPQDRRNKVKVGTILTEDFINVTEAGTRASYGRDLFPLMQDFMISLGGRVNITGNVYSANGANLKLDKSEGTMFTQGSNYVDLENPHNVTSPADTEIEFLTGYRGIPDTIVGQTDIIDTNYYNPEPNNSLVEIPDGFFVAHRLYYSPVIKRTVFQYAQRIYDSMKKAIDSYRDENFDSLVELDQVLLRSVIVVKKGTTDLTDIDLAKFVNVNGLGANTWDKIESNSKFAETVELADGMSYQKQDIFLVEDSGVIYADVEAVGGGDVTYLFRQKEKILDCTTGAGVGGRARVALTAGGDSENPVRNWIYVIPTNGNSTLVSATSSPNGEYAMVATVLLPDVTTFLADKEYSSRGWFDAKEIDGRGAVPALLRAFRINVFPKYLSGLLMNVAIDPVPSPESVNVTVEAGAINQVYKQIVGPFDLNIDGALVINDEISAYTRIYDLNEITTDATGDIIQNNNYYQVLIAGAINMSTGQSQLLIKKPNGVYGNATDAFNDINGFTDTTFPNEFDTVILIGAAVLKYEAAGGGGYVNAALAFGVNYIDLRGQNPGASASGAGTAGVTEFSDAAFKVFNSLDATKEIMLDASSITTGNTWTITMPDKDVTIVDDHVDLSNIGTNTHTQIDTHISDSTIHFTESSIDHVNIQNIGTNTHGQIDTHISDATIHYLKSTINFGNMGSDTLANLNSIVTDATLITDAPADSKDYARNNNAWVEVTGGGSQTPWTSDIDANSYTLKDTTDDTVKIENNLDINNTGVGVDPVNIDLQWASHFDNTTNVIDWSENLADGTTTNVTLTNDKNSVANKAFLFNGTNARADIPNPVITGNVWSLSIWVNMVASSLFGPIVSCGNFMLYEDSGLAKIFDGTSVLTFSGASIPIGSWVHVGVIANNGSYTVYTDSDSRGSQSGIALPFNNTIIIGHNPTYGAYCNVKCDETRLYDRILTSKDINVIYGFYDTEGRTVSPTTNITNNAHTFLDSESLILPTKTAAEIEATLQPDYSNVRNSDSGKLTEKTPTGRDRFVMEDDTHPVSETLWKKRVHIPLSKGLTRQGIAFDGTGWCDSVRDPSVVIVEDTWYMFFAGNATRSTNNHQIGLATSTDGLTFTDAIGSALSLGATLTKWNCSVVYDEYATGIGTDKKWKLWWYEKTPSAIKYATTDDPLGTWTTYSTTGISVLSNQYSVSVTKVGDLYYMVRGNTTLGAKVATSTDMVTWTDLRDIIAPGVGGQWDEVSSRYGSVFWDSGVWYYIYSGNDTSGPTVYQLGLVISPDGALNGSNTYNKFDYNPILGPTGTTWEKNGLYAPAMIRYRDKFYIYYAGANYDTARDTIGLATLSNGTLEL